MSDQVSPRLLRDTPPARHLPPRRTPAMRGPMVLVVLIASIWALALNNAVFIDESLYILAGRSYLDHWFHGAALPADLGVGFSGSTLLYPVLAGTLDMIGGLTLVRLFSLGCLIATMYVVRALTSHLFNARAGLVAAAMFGLTGPAMYVGHLGTFDALVILLLATALWLGLTRDDWRVVPGLAVLLYFAVLTKYAAYVFVPPILVLTCFSRYGLMHSTPLRSWRPVPSGMRVARSALTGLVVAGALLVTYLASSDTARAALAFTTTGRKALSPAPRDHLVGLVPDFVWPLFFAALLGTLFLGLARRWTAVVFALGLLGTSLLLPVGQVILGEEVSFHKHLAYSAMFLAPLAGWGFARPWRLAIWTPVLVWWLILTAMWGMFRSRDLIQYPDVRQVMAELAGEQGTFLSSSADSLAYYTRDNRQTRWESTFALYVGGDQAIRDTVRELKYDAVVIHAGPTGSTIQDAGQQVLLDALDDSRYSLDVVGEEDQWLIYTLP